MAERYISNLLSTREDSASDLTGIFICIPTEILINCDFTNFLAKFWQNSGKKEISLNLIDYIS
jgi:hypothetical protein